MTRLKGIAFLLLTFTAPVCIAGTSDGGGGVGVRCPSSSSSIPFELLDLHEIKLKGAQIADHPTNQDQAIDLSAIKLGNHYYYPPSQMSKDWYIDYVKQTIVEKAFKGLAFQNPINNEVVSIEYVQDLPLSNDMGQYQIKPGCSLEQVAYYNDQTNRLKIVTSRWNELPWLDRSALISHEIQYFLDRYNGLEDFGSIDKKTSERTRQLVGMLYSQTGVQPKYDLLPKSGTFRCETNVVRTNRPTQFEVFATGANEFTAVFELIQGYSSAYMTSAVFTNSSISQITDWAFGTLDSTVQIKIATPEALPAFSVKITKTRGELPRLQAFMKKDGKDLPLGPEEEIYCWDPK